MLEFEFWWRILLRLTSQKTEILRLETEILRLKTESTAVLLLEVGCARTPKSPLLLVVRYARARPSQPAEAVLLAASRALHAFCAPPLLTTARPSTLLLPLVVVVAAAAALGV